MLPPDAIAFPEAILQAHAELVDYTPPTITVGANPSTVSIIVVPVTISGSITDNLSGVASKTAEYVITDSLGQTHLNGRGPLSSNGSYSFNVGLGGAPASRTYTITVTARDLAGNRASAQAFVEVLICPRTGCGGS